MSSSSWIFWWSIVLVVYNLTALVTSIRFSCTILLICCLMAIVSSIFMVLPKLMDLSFFLLFSLLTVLTDSLSESWNSLKVYRNITMFSLMFTTPRFHYPYASKTSYFSGNCTFAVKRLYILEYPI